MIASSRSTWSPATAAASRPRRGDGSTRGVVVRRSPGRSVAGRPRVGVGGRATRRGGPAGGPVAGRGIGLASVRPAVRVGPGLGLVVELVDVGPIVGATARRDEPPELTGSIEADEDLAEQPLVAGRLAPRLEDLDGGVRDGPRDIGLGRPDAIEPLGRREQAAARDQVGVAGAAREMRQVHVGPGPWPDRDRRARWHELDRPADLLAGLGQSRAHQPIAGRRRRRARPRRAPSGPPGSRRSTARPSRARSGAAASNARRMAADCQPHGARPEPPKTASSGSSDAASRPRIQPVAK